MKKIGILGGTFDPVHYGHLILAEQARGEAELDGIVFMPAKVQPFKLNNQTEEGYHRYEMLQKALSGNSFFQVSDLELRNSSEISYTVNTLQALQEQQGADTTLYFIIGTDAFLHIEQWYRSEELLKNYAFVVGTRPGYKEQERVDLVKQVQKRYGTQIIEIHNSEVEISSSDIRERLKKGKSIKYLLPESVENYIYQKGLYQCLDKSIK